MISSLRISRFSSAALLMAITIAAAYAQAPPKVAAPAAPKIAGPGLTFLRYGTHPSQITANNYTGYVPYQELGKPLKAPRTVPSISKWEKSIDENAVVFGYIKIDKAGTYAFRTDSGYDRNELIIDGKIVCKFGDGANKGQTVELREGLLPIVSAAYIKSTTEVRVQWLPPGQKDWSDIPNKLLSHARAD
jgi:hypothetical protein